MSLKWLRRNSGGYPSLVWRPESPARISGRPQNLRPSDSGPDPLAPAPRGLPVSAPVLIFWGIPGSLVRASPVWTGPPLGSGVVRSPGPDSHTPFILFDRKLRPSMLAGKWQMPIRIRIVDSSRPPRPERGPGRLQDSGGPLLLLTMKVVMTLHRRCDLVSKP